LNHFQGAVWLPWSIYLWERAIGSGRWSAIVLFSLVSLCQLLAGSPEIFILSIGLVFLDTIRISSKEKFRGLSGNIARLSLAGLIVVGLGMVQLLPTAELILNSRRNQPIPASEALAWSMRPSSLIGILLPTLEVDSSIYLGVRLLFEEGPPFLLSSYMGVIAIFGLCAWFGAARIKERVILAGLLALSLLCALGSHTPIYPFFYDWLQVFRLIRFPEKFYYVTFALLTFATVRGLSIFSYRESFHLTRLIAAAIPVGWIIAYITFRWDPYLLARWIQPHPTDHAPLVVDPTTIAAILFSLEKQIAVSTLIAGIVILGQLELLREVLWQLLLISVVFVDLSIANKPLHFLRSTEVIQSTARLLEKPPADHGRIFYYPPGNNLHPSFVTVTGSPTYEKGTQIALNNLLPNAGMLYGFEYFQDIDALGRRSYTDFLNFINTLAPDQRGQLLRVLNVKYVVAFHPLEVKGLKLFREFPEHYSRLFEVTVGVPRTYVAARAIFDPDPLNTLRRLSSETFEPLRDVVVDMPTPSAARTSFQGDATINLYQNNKVQIDARLNESGILVLADAFYPGWRVFVDGNERNILRANYLFRGVALEPGHHRVEFDYDPVSFKIGWVISLLTATLLVVVPVVGRIRRRVAPRQSETLLSESPFSSVADRAS
jgi:hypothetical protein